MSGCLDNAHCPTCDLELGEKRNTIASVGAGALVSDFTSISELYTVIINILPLPSCRTFYYCILCVRVKIDYHLTGLLSGLFHLIIWARFIIKINLELINLLFALYSHSQFYLPVKCKQIDNIAIRVITIETF